MGNRALCVLFLAVLFGKVSATTIHVPADQPTIQGGINIASTGDTVLVASGTYFENLDFLQKSITLIGESGASVTTLSPSNPLLATIVITNAPNPGAVVRGFSVANGGSTYTISIAGCATLIADNIIRNNIPVGSQNVEVVSCSNATVTVEHNLFYGNGGIGCVGLRAGSASSIIRNNTFDGNERGFFTIAGGGTAINNIVTHSLAYGVAATDPAQWSVLDYNDVWSNTVNYMTGVAGVHDISADPQFADASSRVYTLQLGSPCIDAGSPNVQYNDPDGSRNDIGAYWLSKSIPLASQLIVNDGSSCFMTGNPNIGWTFIDTAGLVQTGYQVQVGSDGDWTVAEMWDPGVVSGTESSVVYAGATLTNGQVYFLRVRVQDMYGWGEWSQGTFLFKFGGLRHVPGDFPTIQEAIDAAAPCDTIVVGPGVYPVNLTITGKGVAMRSLDGPDATTLVPANGSTAILRISNATSPQTTIEGFTFTGGGSTHTVVISNASPRIQSNIFHDNIPMGSTNVEVISCTNASAVITRNLFYKNHGIGCVGLRDGSQGTSIINNTFDDNERGFFSIAAGGTAFNNIVTRSTTYGVAANSPSNFSYLAYNDVWNNGTNYMTGVAGLNDISVDPLFVDANSRLYELLPGSPCIDVGHPSPQYNDADGTRSDIGAYATVTSYPLATSLQINGNDPCVVGPGTEFSWAFSDTGGLSQTGYQIQVGSDDDWSVVELWDPGISMGSLNAVNYGGPPLNDRWTYFVRVRVQDVTGFSDWIRTSFVYRDNTQLFVPGQFLTIQEALDAASPCDTVIVGPGNYAVNLIVSNRSILLRSAEGPQVTILRPQNPGNPIIDLSGTVGTQLVKGFTVTGAVDRPAVKCTNCSPRITNNIFHHNITFGTPNTEVISLNGASALVDYNVFYVNGGIGCVGLRDGSAGTRIINNTFYANERGFYSIAGGGTALNNIVTQSSSYGVAATNPGHWSVLDYNDVWGNNVNYMTGVAGVHDISVDPQFRNTVTYNLSLKSSSPCINAGDPNPLYNDSDSSRNDLGAIPFTAHAPTAAILIFPPTSPSVPVYDLMPQFSWNHSSDVDIEDTIRYKLQVSLTPGFSLVFTKDSILSNYTKLTDSLQFGTHYWWRIISTDLAGLSATSTVNDFWMWELGDVDKSRNTDIADLTLLIDHLYLSFVAITPSRLADLDGDCHVDIADLSALIDRLYISFAPLKPGCE